MGHETSMKRGTIYITLTLKKYTIFKLLYALIQAMHTYIDMKTAWYNIILGDIINMRQSAHTFPHLNSQHEKRYILISDINLIADGV